MGDNLDEPGGDGDIFGSGEGLRLEGIVIGGGPPIRGCFIRNLLPHVWHLISLLQYTAKQDGHTNAVSTTFAWQKHVAFKLTVV